MVLPVAALLGTNPARQAGITVKTHRLENMSAFLSQTNHSGISKNIYLRYFGFIRYYCGEREKRKRTNMR